MSEYTRRRLLAVGGAATVAGLAGCSGAENTANAAAEGETEPSQASTGSVLETISLENLDDQSHTLDVFFERDGEVEYWRTHELEATGEDDSSLTLDGEWPTEPGRFKLIIRLDDDTRAQFTSTQLPDRDCQKLVILVSREGDLSILTDVSNEGCSTDSVDANSTE